MSGRLHIEWTRFKDGHYQEWHAEHGDLGLCAWAWLGDPAPKGWGGDWHGGVSITYPRMPTMEDAKARAEQQAYRLADDGLTADAAALADQLESARAERDRAIQALRDARAWCIEGAEGNEPGEGESVTFGACAEMLHLALVDLGVEPGGGHEQGEAGAIQAMRDLAKSFKDEAEKAMAKRDATNTHGSAAEIRRRASADGVALANNHAADLVRKALRGLGVEP